MFNAALGRKAFTLVELLVVIAISVILLGLIMIPLNDTFKLTRRTGSLIDAQDSARLTMQQIGRDISQAMFVFDSVDTDGNRTSFGQMSVDLPVRNNDGSIGHILLPNAKLDMIPPETAFHCNNPDHPSGQSRDYSRKDRSSGKELTLAWLPCPICGSDDVEVRPTLPLKRDTTIIRYFLGLKDNDPALGWKSYELKSKAPGDPNPVLLYRVEFDPSNPNLFAAGLSDTDKKNIYNAPDFFYSTATAPDGRPYWKLWKEMAAPVATAKYQDFVTSSFKDDGSPENIAPTVSLRFAGVDNASFNPLGGDTTKGVYGTGTAPTVYKAPDGYWQAVYGMAAPPTYSTTIYRADNATAYSTRMDSGTGDMWVVKYTFNSVSKNWESAFGVFNISDYLRNASNPAYRMLDQNGLPSEMGYYIDPQKGTANFALIPPLYIESGGNAESVSTSNPVDINNDVDRKILLKTYDPTSNNYLPNASIVPDTIRVQVPIDVDSAGKPIYERYLQTDEGNFKPGKKTFWLESPKWIRFSEELPEIQNGGITFPVLIDYQVQFNNVNDVVRGSYVTKNRVDITLGLRVYDPESRRPSTFTLQETYIVGNALR